MKKLKVGDKVRIVNDTNILMVVNMRKECGKIHTIRSINGNNYYLLEDSTYCWHPSLFDPLYLPFGIELKTGMFVKLNSSYSLYVVLINYEDEDTNKINVISRISKGMLGHRLRLDNFNPDLSNPYNDDNTVMCIYDSDYKLLWEREDIDDNMTIFSRGNILICNKGWESRIYSMSTKIVKDQLLACYELLYNYMNNSNRIVKQPCNTCILCYASKKNIAKEHNCNNCPYLWFLQDTCYSFTKSNFDTTLSDLLRSSNSNFIQYRIESLHTWIRNIKSELKRRDNDKD